MQWKKATEAKSLDENAPGPAAKHTLQNSKKKLTKPKQAGSRSEDTQKIMTINNYSLLSTPNITPDWRNLVWKRLMGKPRNEHQISIDGKEIRDQ